MMIIMIASNNYDNHNNSDFCRQKLANTGKIRIISRHQK